MLGSHNRDWPVFNKICFTKNMMRGHDFKIALERCNIFKSFDTSRAPPCQNNLGGVITATKTYHQAMQPKAIIMDSQRVVTTVIDLSLPPTPVTNTVMMACNQPLSKSHRRLKIVKLDLSSPTYYHHTWD